MRQLGTVKWYGGYNRKARKENKYGFITSLEGKDLFFHKKELLCNEELIKESTAVTFELKFNEKSSKEFASEVNLLIKERDVELLTRAILNYKGNYSSKAATAVSENATNDNEWVDNFVKHLDEEIRRRRITDTINTISHIPDFVFAKSTLIRELLPTARKLRYYLNIEGEDNIDRNIIFELACEASGSDHMFWNYIPFNIIAEEGFWMLSPDYTKLKFFREGLHTLREETDHNHIISDLSNILKNKDDHKINLKSVPRFVKKRKEILPYLPLIEQVETIWPDFCEDPVKIWKYFSDHGKLLLIYKSALNSHPLPVLQLMNETESISVKCCLMLVWGKENETMKQKVFKRFDNDFKEYISTIAFNSTDPILLDHFLPPCTVQSVDVRYCEGRPWYEKYENKTERASKAYCPRTNKPCYFFNHEKDDERTKKVNNARIYPNTKLPFYEWSVLELFNISDITPYTVPLNLKYPDEYVPRLAGWINRINEIRQRLKCSVCDEIMKPNMKYAKNLARYNVTIFNCPRKGDHDIDIYLNHCWACRRIIDSRESRIRHNNYYICVGCGSASQAEQGFTQGDICPNCGYPNMKDTGNWHEKECYNCDHTIIVPPDHLLTGLNHS